ncbi:hypothetical protein DH2020_004700 [Rehmannia glutinosa]|uniref:Fe2OG dioxygenase domain-containing protein n=1 Tax=Rehmannia glutinosa TaxID=99300 RepID=A0ABR0XQD0_REHGL
MASADDEQYDDRMKMLKAFDETKAGVKGLMDSGLIKIPEIFVRPSEELAEDELTYKNTTQIQVPVIDLSDIQINAGRRKRIVEQVRIASETWGFFQVVNHGIPLTVLDGMIDGVRKFNEQDVAEKKKYYSRDNTRKIRFNSSYDLFTSKTASWKDTLSISFWALIQLIQRSCLPLAACPQPQLAIGTTKHSDAGFLTILLQNQIAIGLQVLHQGQWIDIQPIPGGLVINIGDLLQLVSNGKFRSNEHRATTSHIGPRISVACFFSGPVDGDKNMIYGPIEELISEENPPIYRNVVLGEYVAKFLSISMDKYRALDYYKL